MALVPRGLAARLAAWRVRPGALVWQPPPPAGGDPARARRLARGVLLLDGRLVETAAAQPWDLPAPDRAWSDALHGHGWLDDAAAADDPALWPRFEGWAWAWIDRYGRRQRARLARRPGGAPAQPLDRLFHPPAARPAARALARLLPRDGRARALSRLALARDRGRGANRGAGRAGLRDAQHGGRPPRPAARARCACWAARRRASSAPTAASPAATPRSWPACCRCWPGAPRPSSEAGQQPADGHVAAMRRAAPVVRALTMPGGTLARFHGGRDGAGLAPARARSGAARRPPPAARTGASWAICAWTPAKRR